ncbi:hypothetical protein OSB04_029486 [Centaurea solstitialis]|uniref:Reverse transcriptase Ty1/copia-type domain-containing protein n=1 Tax=Centaurea solstitialis TaxID=347529 RepID=A0AA38SV62_9ASTR|nr:hypothetical protein OSB04_029486 [Centaurea solstitialis]
MNAEMTAIEKNHTWELVDLPAAVIPIAVKWLFKMKLNELGKVDKYKAGLVVKGYANGKEWIITRNWTVYQLDVKSAFLNGELKEVVHVAQPKGFIKKGDEAKVYRLKHALYGLKQASRAWFNRIEGYFIHEGFKKSAHDHTLFVKKVWNKIIFVSIYVHDLIYAGNDPVMCESYKRSMQLEFEMTDLGKMKFFLGVEVSQNSEGISLCQSQYANEVLRRFEMWEANDVKNPILRKDKSQKLRVFTDSNYAPDLEDRRSTSGYVCLFNGTAICWSSRLLEEHEEKVGTVEIICDNSSTIKLSKDPVMHQITKHIDVCFHYIRELVNKETKPKKVFDAMKDPSWIEAMQEELLQFVLQHVWDLVDLPRGHRAIGTKWIFRNKKDERGIVIKNKARLVAQGYTQEEGIDYDDVFAPVAGIEAIRLFLSFASHKQFKVLQMDVKSAFLYGKIEEEVYVCQPPGFEDPKFPDKFERGVIDKTLFIKKDGTYLLLVQIYVDDIIFGSTKEEMCKEFEALMHKKLKLSSMGELTFFLGLQVKQKEDGILINQSKYVKDMLIKFGFLDSKSASTPMETHKQLTASRQDIMFVVCVYARFQVRPKDSHLQAVKRIFRYLKGQPRLGLWYPYESPFELLAYTDSDYGGVSLDRKSTSVDVSFCVQDWCHGNVLWIQNQMLDYGITFLNTPVYIDNNSAISIVNNPVKHSKTKHIEIKYHFIRDSNEKKLIQVLKVHTDYQYADLFTKAFDVGRFNPVMATTGNLQDQSVPVTQLEPSTRTDRPPAWMDDYCTDQDPLFEDEADFAMYSAMDDPMTSEEACKD